MRRRPALRQLVLLTFGMALGKLDVFHAAGGQLTVSLDQWESVIFTRRGKRVIVPVDEIFRALVEKGEPS